MQPSFSRENSVARNAIPSARAREAMRAIDSAAMPSGNSNADAAQWQQSGYQAGSTASNAAFISSPTAVSSAAITARPTLHVNPATMSAAPPPKFPMLRLKDHQASQVARDLQRLNAARTAHAHASSGSGAHTPASMRRIAVTAVDEDDADVDEFEPEQDLLSAFYTFDPSRSGTMSIQNFLAIMTNMGERWSEEEAIEMAEEIDPSHSGRFCYTQLCKSLLSREGD